MNFSTKHYYWHPALCLSYESGWNAL